MALSVPDSTRAETASALRDGLHHRQKRALGAPFRLRPVIAAVTRLEDFGSTRSLMELLRAGGEQRVRKTA